jgi:hypothetical protein
MNRLLFKLRVISLTKNVFAEMLKAELNQLYLNKQLNKKDHAQIINDLDYKLKKRYHETFTR